MTIEPTHLLTSSFNHIIRICHKCIGLSVCLCVCVHVYMCVCVNVLKMWNNFIHIFPPTK